MGTDSRSRQRAGRPASAAERTQAASAAAALRRALADPAAAGERSTVHIDLSRPRRSEWLTMWAGLPGLIYHQDRKAYTHALLPAWEYTVREMRTEMIEDLDRLAATGEPPKTATR